jgi:hypothetical protein
MICSFSDSYINDNFARTMKLLLHFKASENTMQCERNKITSVRREDKKY